MWMLDDLKAIVKCPDCGIEVSVNEASCPKCGRAITILASAITNTKSSNALGLLNVLLGVLIAIPDEPAPEKYYLLAVGFLLITLGLLVTIGRNRWVFRVLCIADIIVFSGLLCFVFTAFF
jgi:hypothetical protein